MAARYAPIPSRSDPDTNPELDAAFDDSDDDDDASELHPLHPRPPSLRSSLDHTNTTLTYDFNTPVAEWDQPPPGSPPPATSFALPNSIGNSNGIVPTFSSDMRPRSHSTWWRRATAFFPQLKNSAASARTRIMGGGEGNDGVFSNVSAKPTTSGTRVQEGDSIYIVPEESSSAAPPSYAAAQADAAPPYHTSLVLLPPSALYDTNALSGPPMPGSVIVDSLPTGTLFAFFWNTLVSTTFQFVGFVLTWVMHTTHAAKFGSRAGLGITLIQWGFALRARLDDTVNGSDIWEDGTKITFGSTKEADDYYNNSIVGNTTDSTTNPLIEQGDGQWSSLLTGPNMTEWLSFSLMTIGWFLLLTSSLGFWRVKRWERSILASHASNSSSTSRGHGRTWSEIADEDEFRRQSFFERISLFRFPSWQRSSESDGNTPNAAPDSAEDGASPGGPQQVTPWFSDPERARWAREALAREQRLCDDLRAAGLL